MSFKRGEFMINRWDEMRYGSTRAKFAVSTRDKHYLHSDGRVIHQYTEYWPTEEDAQAVLDKFYPKPKHVWKHGDVFNSHGMPMIYLHPSHVGPQAFSLTPCYAAACDLDVALDGATFLFNIREKL